MKFCICIHSGVRTCYESFELFVNFIADFTDISYFSMGVCMLSVKY